MTFTARTDDFRPWWLAIQAMSFASFLETVAGPSKGREAMGFTGGAGDEFLRAGALGALNYQQVR